jgi:hypothetical protein
LDGTTYVTLTTLDSSVHSGYNFFVLDEPVVGIKKFKFTGAATSSCAIAEIDMKGWLIYPTDPALTTI